MCLLVKAIEKLKNIDPLEESVLASILCDMPSQLIDTSFLFFCESKYLQIHILLFFNINII
jgi:hypothetical protein